jgi:hypothetical protein
MARSGLCDFTVFIFRLDCLAFATAISIDSYRLAGHVLLSSFSRQNDIPVVEVSFMSRSVFAEIRLRITRSQLVRSVFIAGATMALFGVNTPGKAGGLIM